MAAEEADVSIEAREVYKDGLHFLQRRPQGQHFAQFESLALESGGVLKRPVVAYKTWGQLDAAGSNCMVICHALSGSADVEDWWGPLVGAGKAFDPSVFFIVSCNMLGSPYGSSSPLSLDPDTGKPYGPTFPRTTVRDSVRLHRRVLEEVLHVRAVQVVIGGSLGGMTALEWALVAPDLVRTVVPVCTTAVHSAWAIATGAVQRCIIESDPDFAGGRYAAQPRRGLCAARMHAMVTYRSRDSFERRFGRKVMVRGERATAESAEKKTAPEADAVGAEPPMFAMRSYLDYQGEKFVQRFDANCYIRLVEIMDSHDVGRARGGVDAALRGLKQPALVIGVTSDVLYPISEQERLAKTLPHAEYAVLESDEGHDAFLINIKWMQDQLLAFFRKHMPQLFHAPRL